MKKLHTSRSSEHDLHPCFPAERRSLSCLRENKNLKLCHTCQALGEISYKIIGEVEKGSTSEKMVIETAPLHEFIDKKPVIIFNTKSNEFHQVWMKELPKKYDLCLFKWTQTQNQSSRDISQWKMTTITFHELNDAKENRYTYTLYMYICRFLCVCRCVLLVCMLHD